MLGQEVIYDKDKKQITGVIFLGNTTITPVATANKLAKQGLIKDVIPYGDTFITGVKNGETDDNLLSKIKE